MILYPKYLIAYKIGVSGIQSTLTAIIRADELVRTVQMNFYCSAQQPMALAQFLCLLKISKFLRLHIVR